MNEDINDVASNPETDEHLPVAGEIPEEDRQISSDMMEDLNEGKHEEVIL